MSNKQNDIWEESQRENLITIIKDRIEYGKKYRLTNLKSGWSKTESGECCDKCKMINPQNPLQALTNCKNPFQLKETCECHLPFRKVAEESIQATLNNILKKLV